MSYENYIQAKNLSKPVVQLLKELSGLPDVTYALSMSYTKTMVVYVDDDNNATEVTIDKSNIFFQMKTGCKLIIKGSDRDSMSALIVKGSTSAYIPLTEGIDFKLDEDNLYFNKAPSINKSIELLDTSLFYNGFLNVEFINKAISNLATVDIKDYTDKSLMNRVIKTNISLAAKIFKSNVDFVLTEPDLKLNNNSAEMITDYLLPLGLVDDKALSVININKGSIVAIQYDGISNIAVILCQNKNVLYVRFSNSQTLPSQIVVGPDYDDNVSPLYGAYLGTLSLLI